LIGEVATELGIREDVMINWEVRVRIPTGKNREALRRVFPEIPLEAFIGGVPRAYFLYMAFGGKPAMRKRASSTQWLGQLNGRRAGREVSNWRGSAES
jgi:hypothetical protein